MGKARILVQLDGDPQPSVFDSVVAIDAGVEHLLRHGGVTPDRVRDLVYGAMFTRGVKDLHQTAIFVGGSDVTAGEAVMAAVVESFFGPLRVSVMMDANGANTTAAAAVLSAERHLPLDGAKVLVLGSTGPVGQRVARLAAAQGAAVRLGSRSRDRAERVASRLAERLSSAKLSSHATDTEDALNEAIDGVQIVVAAGAPGVELLSASVRRRTTSLKLAIDLNAVPPAGLEGVDPQDAGVERDGVVCYGAIGVGGTKMKIHKAAIARLFASHDQVLDAEEIFQIGRQPAT